MLSCHKELQEAGDGQQMEWQYSEGVKKSQWEGGVANQ